MTDARYGEIKRTARALYYEDQAADTRPLAEKFAEFPPTPRMNAYLAGLDAQEQAEYARRRGEELYGKEAPRG